MLQGRQQQPAHWHLAVCVEQSDQPHRTVSAAARHAMIWRYREQWAPSADAHHPRPWRRRRWLGNWPHGRRAAELSLLAAWLSLHTQTWHTRRRRHACAAHTPMPRLHRRGCCLGRPAGSDSVAAAAACLIMPASLGSASIARSCVSALAWLAWDRRLECKQPASLSSRVHVPVLDGRCYCPLQLQAGSCRVTMCAV